MKSNRVEDMILPIFYALFLTGSMTFFLTRIFPDRKDFAFYLLLGLILIPLQGLLIYLFINIALNQRKEKPVTSKNMLIGSFMSGFGVPLLRRLMQFDRHGSYLSPNLQLEEGWTDEQLEKAIQSAWGHTYDMDCNAWEMVDLKEFLVEKRTSLLHLLENPALVEHTPFTDLLWALNHLAEELLHRRDVENLSMSDGEHLAEDMRRAYFLLVTTWLGFLAQTRKDYPFLYSLAVRINPYNPSAKAEVPEIALPGDAPK